MKVEQERRHDAAHDDTKAGSKDFEYVVGVLDDGSHDEAADGLDRDDGPHESVVAAPETLRSNGLGILDVNRQVRNYDGGQSHLDVADPERRPGSFKDFFKVDARKA